MPLFILLKNIYRRITDRQTESTLQYMSKYIRCCFGRLCTHGLGSVCTPCSSYLLTPCSHRLCTPSCSGCSTPCSGRLVLYELLFVLAVYVLFVLAVVLLLDSWSCSICLRTPDLVASVSVLLIVVWLSLNSWLLIDSLTLCSWLLIDSLTLYSWLLFDSLHSWLLFDSLYSWLLFDSLYSWSWFDSLCTPDRGLILSVLLIVVWLSLLYPGFLSRSDSCTSFFCWLSLYSLVLASLYSLSFNMAACPYCLVVAFLYPLSFLASLYSLSFFWMCLHLALVW